MTRVSPGIVRYGKRSLRALQSKFDARSRASAVLRFRTAHAQF
jgi:hypothetical protein